MKTKDTIDAFHAFQIQSNLLTLHLQLAEGDDKPKRSGDFESTYKSKSGVEITVERSSDGKFASKAGSGAASTPSSVSTKSTAQEKAFAGGINTAQIAKDVLSGKLGNQLKESISAGIADIRIKAGVQQANFSEILGKGGDAISSAEKYISEKFNKCAKVASESELCKNIGEILVASTIATGVAFSIAIATGTPITLGTMMVGVFVADKIVSNQKRISENLKKIQLLANADTMKDSFNKVIEGGKEKSQKLLEDIKTVIAVKREEANPAPKVDPQADSAAKAELAGASGASLKNSLITGAAENPNVVAGIEATKMIDIVSGSKDFFSNAKQFVSDKLQEAATATSEKAKDMAIGGAIVGAIAAASATAKGAGAEAARAVSEQVTKLLNSTDIDEKLKAKLESATPQSVKDAIADTKLFMTDALMRKIVIERTKAAIVKAVTDMKAKIESGEATESVLASVKDLKTRAKELGDRAQAAGKLIQDMLNKQDALKQQVDAPASKDNEVTV